ncbi:MAG TPA: TonB family protein [Roseivirga sp.]
MKYNFVNKVKTPSPAEIKSTMSFGKVAANSKALAGAKITSAVLKGTAAVKTAVVSTVSVVAVATTTYITYPEIFTSVNEEPQKPVVEEPFALPIEDSVATIEEAVEDSVVAESTPVQKPISTPKPQPKVVKKTPQVPLLINEDVVIQAFPLPDKESFTRHINRELSYPVQHLGDSIQGFVQVRFKVNKRGQTEDFKISKSLGEAFDNEAIRVIKAYKNWQPASYNGEAVDSYMHMLITFQTK